MYLLFLLIYLKKKIRYILSAFFFWYYMVILYFSTVSYNLIAYSIILVINKNRECGTLPEAYWFNANQFCSKNVDLSWWGWSLSICIETICFWVLSRELNSMQPKSEDHKDFVKVSFACRIWTSVTSTLPMANSVFHKMCYLLLNILNLA